MEQRRTWGLSLLFRPEPRKQRDCPRVRPGLNIKTHKNRPLVRSLVRSRSDIRLSLWEMPMHEKERVKKILEFLKQEYPDAGTRLHFSNRLELLVAVVLSAQSTDEQVNKVTPELFSRFNSAQELAAMDLEELEELIRGVGLYKNKARHIKGLAEKIAADYDGEMPGTFEELLKLPGVGRKSANVMLSVGFDQPGLGVDTHVKRVTRRLGITSGKTSTQIEKDLKRIIPISLWSDSHHLLIAHGRTVCQARKPRCGNCILAALCHRCEA